MITRHINYQILLALLSILAMTGAQAATATDQMAREGNVRPAKTVVMDGHVVHDVGQIRQNVTNWGLIGSAFSSSTPYSDSPSAEWPPFSGNEYLWAAGLWVGGTVDGTPHVSAGGYSSEFRPTPAPEDTIYRTYAGAPGGQRYPWPGADDDGDGLEDEDILNGRDDDLDGLVDEDFAGYGDQHFVASYGDSDPDLVATKPDHTPLGLEVVQQSIQWSDPLGENFIGYDFVITNNGPDTIEQVYVGMYSDNDIGPRGAPGIANDDYAGYRSVITGASDGSSVPVSVAYMYDGGEAAPALDGYVGWVLCGHTTDPAGITAPVTAGVSSCNNLIATAAFENGGDPANDAESYALLSGGEFDPDVPAGELGDYRVLTASGPFSSLAPGQSVHYAVALVMGASLADMISNAAEAVLAYRGRSYDRDGDPTNGAEFQAHWLRGEVPVAAASGRMLARTDGEGAEITVALSMPACEGVEVVRQAGPGVPSRRWTAEDLTAIAGAGDRYHYVLRDDDPVGWPRHYELALQSDGVRLPLDAVAADRDLPASLRLAAGPNPFNPQVNLQVSLPGSGDVLLQVFDVRGALVTTLLEGSQPAGERTIGWNGRDASGRAVPSGVYSLRLQTAKGLVSTRVTLVR